MAPERLQLNSFAPGMPPDPRAAWTGAVPEAPLPVVITEAAEAGPAEPAEAAEADIEVHDGIARRPAAEGRKRRPVSNNKEG
jgi:hypothetical protein